MRLALLLALLLGGPASAAPPPAGLRDGDLVFQSSLHGQGQAVAIATRSRFTHMGVVFLEQGQPWVLEAVEPVRRTPFAAWRARGEGGRVWVRRLRDADRVLTPAVLARMRALGEAWLGRHYDLQFRWGDDRLYCSELAYKLFDRAAGVRLGRVQRAGEMDLAHPEVQRKLRERFGESGFDPQEPVISPQSMYEDPRLVDVAIP